MNRLGVKEDDFESFMTEVYNRCKNLGLRPESIASLLADLLEFSNSISITEIPKYIERRKEEKKKLENEIISLQEQKENLVGETSIYIMPGYRSRLCTGLITNFHQPGSTLILLVAAFIGHDWQKVYQEALNNDYRFLSYGDSSLLLP